MVVRNEVTKVSRKSKSPTLYERKASKKIADNKIESKFLKDFGG